MTRQSNLISENGLTPTDGLVLGGGPAIHSVNTVVTEIAHTNIPVLLTGESGTGKELYARLLHRLSAFSSRPLQKVNCASLSLANFADEIVDSACSREPRGATESGTLFLDEIYELDLSCQRALLSILPDGEPKNRGAELSARLICTSLRDLEPEIEAGRFRRDLYFRINGVCLRLPALRQRKEDIPALLDCFFRKHASELGKRIPKLDSEEMEALMSYEWPGNVRELENVARKIVALGDAKLALGDLRATQVSITQPRDDAPGTSLKVATRAASRRTEKELILRALNRTQWNRKRAAQELQISYKSLLCKLKKIGGPGSETD